MIPAQCGVSLARSEGLMANMRKATAVTATPSSSCSRATSRGKRHTLHLWPSSGAGLSSLFLSEEPFCPCPMSPPVSTLSSLPVLSSFDCCRAWGGRACLLSAYSAFPFPFPSLPRPPLTISLARLLFGNRDSSELIWKTFGPDSYSGSSATYRAGSILWRKGRGGKEKEGGRRTKRGIPTYG